MTPHQIRCCSTAERTINAKNFGSLLCVLKELEGIHASNDHLSRLALDFPSFDAALSKVLANSILFFAEDEEGDIFGCGKLVLDHKLHYSGACVAHVEDVIVLEKWRGRGIGRKIVAEMVRVAREAHCYKIILQCADHNVDFYAKEGFVVRGNNMERRLL